MRRVSAKQLALYLISASCLPLWPHFTNEKTKVQRRKAPSQHGMASQCGRQDLHPGMSVPSSQTLRLRESLLTSVSRATSSLVAWPSAQLPPAAVGRVPSVAPAGTQ